VFSLGRNMINVGAKVKGDSVRSQKRVRVNCEQGGQLGNTEGEKQVYI
jgi:hypothetical protein